MLIEEGILHDSDDTVEFRSMTDDAWHPVLLDLVVNMLFVTYVEVNSTEKQDVYGTHDFDTRGEVEDFRMRFRPSSEPVRDDDCTDVEVGATVCVIKDFGDGDCRLYDGVVNAVKRVEHEAAGTEDEQCWCDFLIFWKHGPLGGTVTSERLDNVNLLVPDTGTHHALIAFMDKTRQRFQTPGKRVQSPTPRMGSRNNSDSITLSEVQRSSARHQDSLPYKWKLPPSGELSRTREMEKPLRMPGIVERKPTMSSSLPPLVSSVEGIRTNHGMSIEFRSLWDDAWHGVNVRMTVAGKLVINYNDYTRFGVEEVHEPDEFNTPGEIEDFRERFRPLSPHLSPGECHEIEVGNLICVRYEFEGIEESRFYDSVVKEIIRYQHAVVDDKEETCFCSFEIFWKHGPKGGTISTTDIHHICMTVPAIEIHPALASFLDIARRELGRARKRARIDGQNPNLPPGFYVGDDRGDVTLSRGEPSWRDKGKKIVINDRRSIEAD